MRIIKLHEATHDGMPGKEIRINGDDIRSYERFTGFWQPAEGEGYNVSGTRITWTKGESSCFAESPEEIDEALFGGFGRKRRPHLADDMTLEVAAVIAGGIMADPNVSTRGGIEGALEAASILIAENAKRRRANRGIRG